MQLDEIRDQINAVDDEILDLFLRRMELSEKIAEIKGKRGIPILNRQREREILSRISARSGDLEEYSYHLFTKIMSLSRARQNELISSPSKVRSLIETASASPEDTFPKTGTVACQGIEGSNAQAACDILLPRGSIMYVKTFRAVFDAVDSGLCRYGIVPIENSTNGSVRAVYELLLERRFYIVRSVNLRIRHELLVNDGARLEDIRRIYSHEQAIGQCSRFLSTLSDTEIIPFENTASAAQYVADSGDIHAASISSSQAGRLYGLKSLGLSIQDSDNNYTRFICISKEPVFYVGSNRISLIISCDDRPGALAELLEKLSVHGVNMSGLESCPVSGRNFEFIFFLDLDADLRDPGIVSMLEDLERSCEGFSLLGCYEVL